MHSKAKNIIILGVVVLLISSLTVTAALVTSANNITFSSSKTEKTNVSDSLNELYDKLDSGIGSGVNNCSEPTTSPVISGDLIPVTIADDGTVTKADTSTKWYSYCEKKWANAVILEDKTQTYNNGDTIPEDNIQSYFVWIPKYKYRLWNVESTTDTKTALRLAHSIDIVFDTTNTIDEEGVSCATPMTSGESGNCTNGEYMTHPAFISLDVNGIWVGKFETGYKGA
ncbi:MAG: hypothetical protein ACI31M_03705, partial [Bacilli bacterium]